MSFKKLQALFKAEEIIGQNKLILAIPNSPLSPSLSWSQNRALKRAPKNFRFLFSMSINWSCNGSREKVPSFARAELTRGFRFSGLEKVLDCFISLVASGLSKSKEQCGRSEASKCFETRSKTSNFFALRRSRSRQATASIFSGRTAQMTWGFCCSRGRRRRAFQGGPSKLCGRIFENILKKKWVEDLLGFACESSSN